MSRALPPAQALHAFDAAARHMSFTEAARELGVTQAAISQRIRVLEHSVGQPLFVRHPRGLELTAAGRSFVPAVREAFERLTMGVMEAFGPTRGEGTLTLRATPGFIALWLAPRLPRFQAEHPEITLRLTTAVWPSDFGGEGSDLEVRYGRGGWHDVLCLRLTEERIAPVCRRGMALGLETPADMAGLTLIHAVGFETGWPRWLATVGEPALIDRNPALLCDTMDDVQALAVQGSGIAMGRSSLVSAALADGRLVAPFDHWVSADEAFHLTRPRQFSPRPETAAFWEWMRREIHAPDDTVAPDGGNGPGLRTG
ncbi:Glycine cleavage system transcriptional activator [wastewater metagenome]|uniref:Glycine cleavage system transcriptional activator n=2 Tax=unclassified sequences TaxID=12908 RepID=A0A5B8R5V1_9ZZZZ|nr:MULTISPECIES: LysR substrate-binding domain-containing protein [Arhodomonas]MCS4504152.1 LysR substrate-binding domain-containing protein [Arhodomonas aquaeolei]QEA03950.1 glycine cleavage system transcriptional activator [uncultured organism]